MQYSSTPRHDLGFAITCVAVLAAACVLRLQPWRLDAAPAAQPAATAAAVQTAPAVPPGLGLVILEFYDKIDRGLYDAAYDVSLENKWAIQPDGSYEHAGLVSKQEFVDSLTAEFGINGVSVRLDAIQFEGATPLPLPQGPSTNPPEYAILAHLPAGFRLTGLYQVQMHGALGDSCTPLPWYKRVIMASSADGQLRVLLPGGPRPGNTHKNELFTDNDPFGGSQLSDQEASS